MYLQNRTINQNRDFEADTSITAGRNVTNLSANDHTKHVSIGDFIIEAGSNVNFYGGNAIILKPGFRVTSGSQFRAFIEEPFDEFPVFKIEGNSFDLSSNNNIIIDSNVLANKQLIENEDKTQSISVYPNPTNGMLYIYNETYNITKVEVYSYNGALLLIKNLKSPKFVIDLKSQPDGIYLLKISYGKNNSIITKKIVKQ
jgi:hypothetical protein